MICNVGLVPRVTHSGSAVKEKVKSLSHVRLSATPWTVAYQAPLSMGFSRKNTRAGYHFLLQRIFPTQGSNPSLPHWRRTLIHLTIMYRYYVYYVYLLCIHLYMSLFFSVFSHLVYYSILSRVPRAVQEVRVGYLF